MKTIFNIFDLFAKLAFPAVFLLLAVLSVRVEIPNADQQFGFMVMICVFSIMMLLAFIVTTTNHPAIQSNSVHHQFIRFCGRLGI